MQGIITQVDAGEQRQKGSGEPIGGECRAGGSWTIIWLLDYWTRDKTMNYDHRLIFICFVLCIMFSPFNIITRSIAFTKRDFNYHENQNKATTQSPTSQETLQWGNISASWFAQQAGSRHINTLPLLLWKTNSPL